MGWKLSGSTMPNKYMTPSLARAARAILNWSMDDLAERIGVGPTTIRDYENGSRTPHRLTRQALEAAFLEAGIEFLGGAGKVPGLLVHKPELLDNPPPPRNTTKKRKSVSSRK